MTTDDTRPLHDRHPDCSCDFDDEESDLCPFHERMLGPLSWRTLAFMVIDLSDATRRHAALVAALDNAVKAMDIVLDGLRVDDPTAISISVQGILRHAAREARDALAEEPS